MLDAPCEKYDSDNKSGNFYVYENIYNLFIGIKKN